jgi:peptidyl-tRNA hydrolase, PTH1 family
VYLVAGLGNPERRYAGNRHNAGFMVVAALARRAGEDLRPGKFDGLMARVRLRGEDALLLQPMTYMNRSGQAVGPAARFYKVDPATELVVIHDELDLPFGTVRVKQGGGHAGHNGLKSIAASLGTGDFLRIRFGIGRPAPGREVTGHVLSDFSAEEAKDLPAVVDRAADAVEAIVAEGALSAMNRFNQKGA